MINYALEKGAEQWFIDAFYYVNKLTYAQYKEYFDILQLEIIEEKKIIRKLDMDFYNRFEDKLWCYPVFDLELDFFHVLLKKKQILQINPEISTEMTNKISMIESQIQEINCLGETVAKLADKISSHKKN